MALPGQIILVLWCLLRMEGSSTMNMDMKKVKAALTILIFGYFVYRIARGY
ncbi:hypothetical protein SBF1_4100003 [Candidatus Desulfosporosinus infrequens]|uniref:Uncharacterized protein n=1 Tax=Candidatus Desulfosporosinus infrequens TaxID=2043169 RepID=A0A2U3L928_9FIRM|nr:hypothetical protein SBF1_4100003 [Candidatus Desulfosporosinus infrequens]